MVQLLPADIRTKEVLDWDGLHVFHYQTSSCSQKLRIFLNLKGLKWQGHDVDLLTNENLTPYFLGINPRGLVPVIVEDGAVHIESNDIMLHLEDRHPEPRLIPGGMAQEAALRLQSENDLHLDLRALSFRFLFDPSKPSKTGQDLRRYAATSTATVRGARDGAVEREVSFWTRYLDGGVSDDQARRSAKALRAALDLIDGALGETEHILGDRLSMVDIAWLVYAQRLTDCGYPMRDMHPDVAAWQTRLMERPAIARELALPAGLLESVGERHRVLRETKRTLADICFPELGGDAVPG